MNGRDLIVLTLLANTFNSSSYPFWTFDIPDLSFIMTEPPAIGLESGEKLQEDRATSM